MVRRFVCVLGQALALRAGYPLSACCEAHAQGKPFFVWWNGTRMHFRTHVKEELRGISGQDEYADGMVEHDMHVGKFLDLLDELGIADNTVVFYSTDNGPHYNSWPDAAATPFRGEKNTNWEGGWRVPAMVRWPGRVEAGSISNEIVHHMDWFPTLVAAAGKDDIITDLLDGYRSRALGRNYRIHLDDYNILPLLMGETDESPRKEIFYFSDDGDLTALSTSSSGDGRLRHLATRMATWRCSSMRLAVKACD
jgi:arylsulfatase A-like enzyme